MDNIEFRHLEQFLRLDRANQIMDIKGTIGLLGQGLFPANLSELDLPTNNAWLVAIFFIVVLAIAYLWGLFRLHKWITELLFPEEAEYTTPGLFINLAAAPGALDRGLAS